MNWKERYNTDGFIPLEQDKVVPGMVAKLIVGNETSWRRNCWINDMKGKVFEVYDNNNEGKISIKLPISLWKYNDIGCEEEEQIAQERGWYEVLGPANWFLFK